MSETEMVEVEVVSVLVDGKLTPSLSRELRDLMPSHLPDGAQAFTADGLVLTIEPEPARELARLLRGARSVRVSIPAGDTK